MVTFAYHTAFIVIMMNRETGAAVFLKPCGKKLDIIIFQTQTNAHEQSIKNYISRCWFSSILLPGSCAVL